VLDTPCRPKNASALPEIYSYIGNTFDTFINNTPPDGMYDATDRVTGFFTVPAPLAPNLDLFTTGIITPQVSAFSFFDGRTTIDQNNFNPALFNVFNVSTDGVGTITFWEIRLFSGPAFPALLAGEQTFQIQTVNVPATVTDTGLIAEAIQNPCLPINVREDEGRNRDNTGGWSSAPIPEPSTMLLLGSGLAGLGFFRWRRKAA